MYSGPKTSQRWANCWPAYRTGGASDCGHNTGPRTAAGRHRIAAHVQQLVGDSGQLLVKRQIQEPRQVKVQQIEHLPAVEFDTLDGEFTSAADRVRLASVEPQGRQRRIQSARHLLAGLPETDGDPPHVDVAEFVDPGRHVGADENDMGSEIER